MTARLVCFLEMLGNNFPPLQSVSVSSCTVVRAVPTITDAFRASKRHVIDTHAPQFVMALLSIPSQTPLAILPQITLYNLPHHKYSAQALP